MFVGHTYQADITRISKVQKPCTYDVVWKLTTTGIGLIESVLSVWQTKVARVSYQVSLENDL